MPGGIAQIGLIILLIIPGYASYTMKEMWSIHRDKTQFEKLLNSLIYSSLLWSVFWLFFEKTPRYYLNEGSIPELIGWKGIVLILEICVFAYVMTIVDKNRWFFRFGKKRKISNKLEHNYSLFDYIFNDTNKHIASVEIKTLDGCTYYGRNLTEYPLITSTSPYSGDISFICESSINKDGESIEYSREELITESENQNQKAEKFILKTYIPKRNIKFIRYEESFN